MDEVGTTEQNERAESTVGGGVPQQETKQYKRNFTPEARMKQIENLKLAREIAKQKKLEMGEQTLKAKLLKQEKKKTQAAEYDEYIKNKLINEQKEEKVEKVEMVGKVENPQRAKKIIYKEVSDDEEEEIVYVKKNKPKPETLDMALYRSAQEKLVQRVTAERFSNSIGSYTKALTPVEF